LLYNNTEIVRLSRFHRSSAFHRHAVLMANPEPKEMRTFDKNGQVNHIKPIGT